MSDQFTRPLGVIGDPISHSRSPQLHGYLIEKYNLPFHYHAYHVTNQHVAAAISGAEALGFRGLNVTVPHKQTVMPLLGEIDPLAKQVGAVNTIMFEDGKTRGFNTDVDGILLNLAYHNITLQNRDVMILGAGGAARAMIVAAQKAGAKSIPIQNRTKEKADELAQEFGVKSVALKVASELPDKSVIINSTSVGMHPNTNASPLPQSIFRKELVYVDIVYNPLQTQFLQHAQSAGAKTVTGIGMLIFQGIRAMEYWAGIEIEGGKHVTALEKVMLAGL